MINPIDEILSLRKIYSAPIEPEYYRNEKKKKSRNANVKNI